MMYISIFRLTRRERSDERVIERYLYLLHRELRWRPTYNVTGDIDK